MRKFIAAAAMLLLCLCLSPTHSEAAEMERTTLNFNTLWLYSPKDYSNAQLRAFDDGGFENVSLPHANTVLKKHKGPDFQKEIDSYRFVSWYRRHFSLPKEFEGKRIIAEFQGVATAAKVYVNGKYIGEHRGAYTGFSFDITDSVSFGGGDNVIAVRVDSERRSDIPPEGGSVDYCLFGGIVRDVTLTAVNPLYAENSFISAEKLSEKAGQVRSEISVLNSSGEDKACMVETVIFDAEGNEAAASVSEEKTVPAGDAAVFTAVTDEIANPHLWDTDDPYLYTAQVRVIEGGGAVDKCETKIGLRWFEFKSEENDGCFYLNGKKLKLRGVNRHEQWPWQGRAVPNKLQAADADLIKNTGFNAVRCSHYPQDPEFLSRCDELGLIVFEEAPGWQHIGDDDWKEVYKTNLREMILRDRNHPSIVTWGVRVNESWDSNEFYASTSALAKSLDPTRPTHGVRRNENYNNSEMIEDIFCANYIYPEIPKHTPFISSEHSWTYWTKGNGLPSASDADAMAYTRDFADVVDYYYGNNLCAGGFAWCMFDYNNEVNYTKTDNVFYSGVYDIFRLDKPAAHFYRSQKNPEEEIVLYIANYWTESSPSEVQVYSNCDRVELFVNGVSRGRISPNLYMNVPHPAFSFKNIEFQAGELKAVGYINGEKAAEEIRRTPEDAAAIRVTPDYSSLAADGADMTAVTVELVDKNGTRLPYADNEVTITVEGPAQFIGEDAIALEGGRAGFMLKSVYHETGEVKCVVSAEGVEGGECSVEILPYADESTVPYSFAEGTVPPLKVECFNDTDAAFEYSGGWQYCAQSGCHMSDNHYSRLAGDKVTFTFFGDCAQWYGSKAPAHGIMAVSVDGGEETFFDCYSETREDGVLLFSTGSLGLGAHTVTVRVTGEKSPSASDCYVTADRVKVFECGSCLGSRLGSENFEDWNFSSESWRTEGGKLIQSGARFGDNEAIFNENIADASIRARVSLPKGDDKGCGILGRALGGRFYQLEIKGENGGYIWGIWKNSNGNWALLASGPFESGGEGSALLRFDLSGHELSAFVWNGSWLPLGSSVDYSYESGGIGLRTHNTDGEFEEIAAYEIHNSPSHSYELKDIFIENGLIKSLRVYGAEEGRLIAAKSEDGRLIEAKSFNISPDGVVDMEDFPTDGNVKLFIWNSVGGMIPLSDSWKM